MNIELDNNTFLIKGSAWLFAWQKGIIMNRNGKILLLVTSIVLVVIIALVIIFVPKKTDTETPGTDTIDTQTDAIDGSAIYVSTASWADRAWTNQIAPEKIKNITFTQQKEAGVAVHAWVFDGISCFYFDNKINVVVKNGIKITGSMNGAFRDMINLESVTGLELVDTSEVKDMGNLFNNCNKLTEVAIEDIEMNSVVNAEAMFYECNALTEINMQNNDLTKATNLDYMFSHCSSVDKIYLPKTYNIKTMKYIFDSIGTLCDYKTDIIGTLNTQDCEDMSYMFKQSYCYDYKIAENFDTSSLKNAEGMFYNCSILDIDLSKWNTKNLQSTKAMFWSNMGLIDCNLDGWDVSSLETCEEMFMLCTSIIPVLNWDNAQNVKNTRRMFRECISIDTLDVSFFNGNSFTNAIEMFAACERATKIYCTGFSADVSTDMFRYCFLLSGSKSYSEDKIDIQMANTNGYFTER